MFRPTDDGTTMEAPGFVVNAALDYSVTHVRKNFFYKNSNNSYLHSRDEMVKVLYLFGHRVMVVHLMMIVVLMVMHHIQI